MYQATKQTLISDIVENAPEAMPFFQAIGMHCLGCVMASGENIEEACGAHGIDTDKFVETLNEFLSRQG